MKQVLFHRHPNDRGFSSLQHFLATVVQYGPRDFCGEEKYQHIEEQLKSVANATARLLTLLNEKGIVTDTEALLVAGVSDYELNQYSVKESEE